ncbi:hypothetical protein FDUTEX481_07432 [Tolypothrix sp. PCC 7601]|nr:hypothetical protein FDUTEX481_07432 [Tolypothrix sp. PCC 7601]
MYKYLAPSSPNPFSRRRRGTKSLAPLSVWAGGEGETLQTSGFHVKLTPLPLKSVVFFFKIRIT